MKIVRVVLSPQAEQVYRYLNEQAACSKIEHSILNAVNKKVELIKINPHYGEPVAKSLIPLEYKTTFGATNLFRVELPNFWRMLYTLTGNESQVEIIAFVLDITDHAHYDKKFGYRGK